MLAIFNFTILIVDGVKIMANDENKPKCCTTDAKDSKKEKGILQKIWCFFFGCNCH